MSHDPQAVPSSALPGNNRSSVPSPPDSNNASKVDGGSDSELSDIEDHEDIIGTVVPDGWSGEKNTGVPIFRPTMAQFKDFEAYVSPILEGSIDMAEPNAAF